MKKIFLIYNNVMISIIGILGIASTAATIKLFDNYNLAVNEYNFYHAYSISTESSKNKIKTELEQFINTKYNSSEDMPYLSLDTIVTKSNTNFKNFLSFLKNKNNENSIIYNLSINNRIKNNIETVNFQENLSSLKSKVLDLKDENSTLYNASLKYVNNVASKNYIFNKTPENISFIAGVIMIVIAIIWAIIFWVVFTISKIKTKK